MGVAWQHGMGCLWCDISIAISAMADAVNIWRAGC